METVNFEHEDFSDVDELLGMIIPPTDSQRLSPHSITVELLGGFLEGCLANMGWSPDDLAQAIHVTPAFAQAMVAGKLPDSELSDALVVRLANVIGYEPNVLHVLLDRDFISSVEPEEKERHWQADQLLTHYQVEIDRLLNEIMEFLLQAVDSRYADAVRLDQKRARQHDFVIKQIEMIIARHRADLRLVESMIDELQAEPVIDTTSDLRRLDIRRIIHYLEEA